MDNSINERINFIISNFRYRSVRAFAEKLGIAPTSLNGIVNGAEPKYSTLYKILKVEPSISAEWLMLGTGNMKKEPTQHVGDIKNSTAVVNYGDGNEIANNRTSPTEELLQLQREYLEMLKKKDEQIDRLTGVIEKLMGKL